MCGRAASQIRDTLPIRSIVSGVHSGFAEIGYFVVFVSSGRKGVYQCGEEVQATVLIYL